MEPLSMNEIQASLQIIKLIADAIKEAGQIPSGHLYAILMSHGVSLSTYEKIINILINTHLIIKKNDLLIWNLK